jgi:superfamily II DNA helicase RecQ
METVTVQKTATQFVPGNPDFWSILVFYDQINGTPAKETEKTPPLKEEEKAPTLKDEDLTENEKVILAALKLWRKDRAVEIQLPEFMVCHNATLLHIAREKPQSLSALNHIKGLGAQKIARYGDDIIAIINAF